MQKAGGRRRLSRGGHAKAANGCHPQRNNRFSPDDEQPQLLLLLQSSLRQACGRTGMKPTARWAEEYLNNQTCSQSSHPQPPYYLAGPYPQSHANMSFFQPRSCDLA